MNLVRKKKIVNLFTIKIQAFNPRIIHQLIVNINKILTISNKISLPNKYKKWTILRSPHIYKKAREQLEIRIYRVSLKISSDSFYIIPKFIQNLVLKGVLLKLSLKKLE